MMLTTLLTIATSPALAKCARPGPAAYPTVEVLASEPVLHLFVPKHQEPDPIFTLDGVALDVELVPVSETPAYSVFRAEIPADEGALTLNWGYRNQQWTLDPDADVDSAPASIGIEKAEMESSGWVCSYTSLWNLTPTVLAPVYRVEVAADRESWSAGKRRSFLVPGDLRQMWGVSAVNTMVQVGHANCFGHTFEWADDDASVWVALVGVYPDGTETELGTPIRLPAPPPRGGTRR